MASDTSPPGQQFAPQKILLCFAVATEARQICLPPGRDIQILLTGIGPSQARKKLEDALKSSTPDLVITAGFAGGLGSTLAVGEVLFDVSGAGVARGVLQKCGAKPGRFLCVDRIITTGAEKRRLGVETGLDAVEMESGVIREICLARKIPAMTVRVIFDEAREDLPIDFNQLSGPGGNLSCGKLLKFLLVAPSRVKHLMQLNSRANKAAKNLAAVLNPLLQAIEP